MKTYLVNVELPNSGMSETTADYKHHLVARGYTLRQAIGSLGGTSKRSTSIANGTVTRN